MRYCNVCGAALQACLGKLLTKTGEKRKVTEVKHRQTTILYTPPIGKRLKAKKAKQKLYILPAVLAFEKRQKLFQSMIMRS